VTSEGLPDFLVRDLPPKGVKQLVPSENRVYFGERIQGGDYVVVGTDEKREIDYPTGDSTVRSSYEGAGGITLSSMTRRLAFALRFGDTDMLISDFIDPGSKVLMRRNIIERVHAAAPFLQFDKDPYMVVVGGKMKWIVDAYTSTDRYPYAQRIDLSEVVGPDGFMSGHSNYLRNSVKIVVDAYEGTTDFYVMDPSDALISTYQAAFPGLFKPEREMSAALRQHLRYPEDFFKVQATQYRLYHMLKPDQFYAREDAWDIPIDPVAAPAQTPTVIDPYYVVMKLPWEDEEEFLLMLPFQPKNRPTLNGWVAARMDPGHYGELVALNFPRTQAGLDSPQNVHRRINQNEEISRQFTLWDGAGSNVGRGPISVIPIEKTLMYVQPIYLTSEGVDDALPELRRVIVVLGDQIGFESTLQASLQAAIEGKGPSAEPSSGEAPEPTEPSETGSVSELLDRAAERFAAAEEALRDGDLAAYQRENEAGARLVEQARNSGE
jgi:uncharacterized membrane protein (UPF0182 family)